MKETIDETQSVHFCRFAFYSSDIVHRFQCGKNVIFVHRGFVRWSFIQTIQFKCLSDIRKIKVILIYNF